LLVPQHHTCADCGQPLPWARPAARAGERFCGPCLYIGLGGELQHPLRHAQGALDAWLSTLGEDPAFRADLASAFAELPEVLPPPWSFGPPQGTVVRRVGAHWWSAHSIGGATPPAAILEPFAALAARWPLPAPAVNAFLASAAWWRTTGEVALRLYLFITPLHDDDAPFPDPPSETCSYCRLEPDGPTYCAAPALEPGGGCAAHADFFDQTRDVRQAERERYLRTSQGFRQNGPRQRPRRRPPPDQTEADRRRASLELRRHLGWVYLHLVRSLDWSAIAEHDWRTTILAEDRNELPRTPQAVAKTVRAWLPTLGLERRPVRRGPSVARTKGSHYL
jgi:hypothetical protein